jgi:hypothetical protein
MSHAAKPWCHPVSCHEPCHALMSIFAEPPECRSEVSAAVQAPPESHRQQRCGGRIRFSPEPSELPVNGKNAPGVGGQRPSTQQRQTV